MTPPEFHNSD